MYGGNVTFVNYVGRDGEPANLCNLSRVEIVTGHSGKKTGIEKEKDEKLKQKTEEKERKVVGGQL